MNALKLLRSFFALAFFVSPLFSRDVILEFKGAYFLPTHCDFRHIYHDGSGLYGAELTAQLCNNKYWYGFASIDYFRKKGHSLGLCSPTKVSLLPLAFGLKYFVPMLCECADFYLGLGFQPVHVSTTNCSKFVIEKQSRWGLGGIAKTGVYYYLPRNFLVDFFVDYSFVKVDCKNKCHPRTGPVILRKANVSGAAFGVGVGYRF